MPAHTVELSFERHTKHKVVFTDGQQFGAIYIPNDLFKDLGSPEALRLTLEPAAAPALRAA